jgi:hypothetical protein
MDPKLPPIMFVSMLSLSVPGVAMGNGTPMGGHGPSGGHLMGAPGWGPGHQSWHGGVAQFGHSVWRTGHWWHGKRGNRFGWWWNVGPYWYWYPFAIYPFPDFYTPPYSASGSWYWCDFYQNYYPNVALCPSGWEAVEPQ